MQQRYWTGLGNQLFILAAGESFAKQSGREFYIHEHVSSYSPHSHRNYYDSILKGWRPFYRQMGASITFSEAGPVPEYPDWGTILKSREEQDIQMTGFFQHWKYIEPVREEFVNRLSFNTQIQFKYPDISEKVFLHVRGGDYLTWGGFVDLTKYYRNCLDIVKPRKIVVFTNDQEYTRKILEGIDYEIINENEEDSLFLMSKCYGGICANSSFSWWGAYLNPNRPIFIPSGWGSDPGAFKFPGATIVDV